VWLGKPKANMVPPAEKRIWRYLESVTLDNARDPYPADSIGVAIAWQPPEAQQILRFEQKMAVLAEIATLTAGNPFSVAANPRSSKWVGGLIAKRAGLDIKDRSVRADLVRLVDAWVAAGEIEKYRDYSPAEGRNIELIRSLKQD
jgi:hypothetical protein